MSQGDTFHDKHVKLLQECEALKFQQEQLVELVAEQRAEIKALKQQLQERQIHRHPIPRSDLTPFREDWAPPIPSLTAPIL